MAVMVNASGGVSSSGLNASNNVFLRESTPDGSFDSQDLEDQVPLVASGTALMNAANSPPSQARPSQPQQQQWSMAQVAPTTTTDKWAARKAALRKAIEYVITSSS